MSLTKPGYAPYDMQLGEDRQYVTDMINNEGFHYFFLDYIGPESFKDRDVRNAVERFSDAREALEQILLEKGVEL